MNTFYLLIFIILTLFILARKRNISVKDTFVNFNLCQQYNDKGQHCPYRVMIKDGVKNYSQISYDTNNKHVKLYNQDILNGSYTLSSNNIIDSKCATSAKTTPKFVMFADKYPVAIKQNNNTYYGKCS